MSHPTAVSCVAEFSMARFVVEQKCLNAKYYDTKATNSALVALTCVSKSESELNFKVVRERVRTPLIIPV